MCYLKIDASLDMTSFIHPPIQPAQLFIQVFLGQLQQEIINLFSLYDRLLLDLLLITSMKQTSPDDLLGDNQIIQISFKDSEQDEQYPSLNVKNNLEQSVFGDDGGMYKAVKKSSFKFQDSYNDQYNYTNSHLSQSFSALNGSIREQNIFRSKLKVQVNEAKQPKQKDYFDLNKSIFTDRPNAAFAFNRNSEDKDKNQPKQQQYTHEQGQFEMKPIIPSVSTPKQPNKQVASSYDIKVILRSTNYFLQKSNGDSLMVNGEMLRDLYDEFFKKQIFIPLFKYQKFDEWNNSKDKFNIDLEAHRVFKMSLQRYIKYMNTHYPKEFSQVFKLLQQIQRGKVSKKRQQASFGFLNFDFASIVQSLKNYISSSKTQILRNNKLARIRSVRQTMKIAQLYGLAKEVQIMTRKIEQEWEQLGEIQLLLNFQQTEYYCTKKIENSPELKFRQIWIKYRDYIRNQKMHHSQQSLKSILV